VDYLEQDPHIKELYESFGFAADYTSAISPPYTLEDVHETKRPHPLANCLTCKTPDYTKLVNDTGVEAYKLDSEEPYGKMVESTGTGMLKAQPPEFESFLGEGSFHARELNCADYHMAVMTEGKTTYTSHKWESSLANPTILNTCVECHGGTDMTEKVKAIQEEITGERKKWARSLRTLWRPERWQKAI